jgi:hypothetical protein
MLRSLLKKLPPAQSNSRSGIVGLRWRRDARAWQVTVCGRHVGYRRELVDAVKAAIKARAR